MRSVFVAAGSFLTALLFLTFAPLAFGQGGTGTITGTVTDPTGLGSRWSYRASHERRNRWRLYRGNNCRRKLHRPEFAGRHLRLSVKVQGFKTYTHTNLTIAAAQTLKEDIPLQVGATTESITVEGRSFAAENRNRRHDSQCHRRAIGRAPSAGHRNRQLRHIRLPQSLQHASDASGRE